MIASEIERGFQTSDTKASRDCRGQRREFRLKYRGPLVFTRFERAKDLNTKLRHHAPDGENRARRTSLQSIEQDSAIASHHCESRRTKSNRLSKPCNVVRTVLHADDVRMLAQTRHRFRFDLDAGKRGML